MRIDIHFAHKVLILTDSPVEMEGAHRLPSSKLSRANVLKIFETTNTIVVIDSMIEYYIESFKSEFKYVEAAGGLVENEKGETADVCAVREVAEETGVKGAKIVRFLCNTFHAYDVYGAWELKRTSWYHLSAKSCEPKPQKEEDILVAKWCSAEEVEENLRATYPTIRNVFAIKEGAKNE